MYPSLLLVQPNGWPDHQMASPPQNRTFEQPRRSRSLSTVSQQVVSCKEAVAGSCTRSIPCCLLLHAGGTASGQWHALLDTTVESDRSVPPYCKAFISRSDLTNMLCVSSTHVVKRPKLKGGTFMSYSYLSTNAISSTYPVISSIHYVV